MPSGRRLEPAVIAAFRANQQRLVDDRARRYRVAETSRTLRAALASDRLNRASVTVDRLYRSPGEATVYFESHVLVTAELFQLQGFTVRGWIAPDATGRMRPLNVSGDLISEESNPAGSPWQVPIGSVQWPGGPLWVMVLYDYESSGYAIDHITPAGIHRVISAGDGGG